MARYKDGTVREPKRSVLLASGAVRVLVSMVLICYSYEYSPASTRIPLSRCGRSPRFHTVHAVLAHAIRRCCEAAGATDADLRGGKRGRAELRGLRSDGTRPAGDVAWLHYHERNRNLPIDATVASVFCLACHAETRML